MAWVRHFAVGFLACALPAVGATANETGVTADEIVIGATNASTGPIAACGAEVQGSIGYFKRINDAGGIHGRKIRYVILDDAYSAQRAAGNVRRLIEQDKAFAIFGGCGTVTAAAALPEIERVGIPYLFPFAGLDKLVIPPQKNVFALVPLYTTQLATILPFVVERSRPKTAALFTFNFAGNAELRKVIRDKLEGAGVAVLADAVMEATSPDRSTFALQAKAANPDLLIVNDSPANAARFLLETQRQNWKPKVVTGISTLADESFLRAVGDAADGLVLAPAFVRPPAAAEARECVQDVAAVTKDTPTSFMMYGCLAAKVLVEALKLAGPELTRDKFISALEKIKEFDSGLGGKISFGPGQRMGVNSIFVVAVDKGEFRILTEVGER